MNHDNEPSAVDVSKNSGRKNGYSIASFILSATPPVILTIGYLFCLIFSGGGVSDNDGGAIWWLFVILIWILVPVAIITNILSLIFGAIGIKANKTVFAWSGITIVALEILAVLLFSGITTVANIPTKYAENQEKLQMQEVISKSETYADLTQFGLGIYKLQEGGNSFLGNPFLWDITQEGLGGTFGDIEMVFDYCRNLKSGETWDDSNRGKDVLYDVKLYEGTYIIIIPEPQYIYDEPIFYINICKDLNLNVDLFQVVIYDQEVIEKLHELPGEKLSRQELIEKLGKTKWENVTKSTK